MTSIILSNPQNLDLRTLGDITRQSLALLKPWTLLGNSTDNLVVQRVSAEAAQYVDAIKLGVSAAYSGFTVTEEVIFLAECLPCNDSADLQRYLVGMLELAKTARENANKAFDAFRSVRQQIALISRDVQEEVVRCQGTGQNTTALNTLTTLPQDLQEAVEVLVQFADHTSAFASWWDWVKIESDPHITDQPIEFQLDSLRDQNVINRWRNLRSQYTAYVQMVGEMEDTDPLLFRRARSNNSVPQILTSGAGGQRALLSSLFGILRRRSNVRAITAPAQTPALFNVASGATSFLRSIWYPEIESNTLPPSQSPQRNIGEVDDAPVVRQDITSLMGNLSVLSALKCTPPCSNETIPLHLEDTVTSFPPAITSPTNGDLGQPPSIDNHRPSVDSGTNAHVGFHSVSATRKLSSEAATFIESDDGRPDLGPYPVLSGDETGEDFAIVNRTLTATPEPVPHLTVLPTAAAVKISEASAMPVSPYDSSTHYVIVDEKSAYNPIQGENPQSLVCKACLHSFLSELLTQQFHGNSTKGSDRIKNRSGSPTNSHLKGHGNLKQRLNFRRKTMEPAAFQDPSYPNSQSGLPVLPSSRKVERQIDQPRFKFIDDMKNAGWVIRVRGVKKWNFRGSKDGVIAEPFTNQSSTNTADVTTANGADKPGKGVKGVKAHALLNVFDEKQLSEWNANIRKNPNKQKDFSKLSKSELLQRLWKKLEAQGYSEEVIVKKIEEKGITSVTSKIPDQTTNSTGTYLCDIHRTG